MRLLGKDFYRFFVIGFAAGAAIVVAGTDGVSSDSLSKGLVPVAEAAPNPGDAG